MSKVVFFSTPVHGHTNPTIPLVKELVSRGEEVAYYSNRSFEEKIQPTGAHYRCYQSEPLASLRAQPDNLAEISHMVMRAVGNVLDQELPRFREEKPDYIIYDSLALWGRCVSQILRLPAACSVTTFVFGRKLALATSQEERRSTPLRSVLSGVPHILKALRLRRGIRKRHGLGKLRITDMFLCNAELNIVYTSRLFLPFSESFDERFQFVGPAIADRQEQVDFPWDKIQHPVVVYVSLGTLFNRDREFFRICFEALGDLDLQVVVSTGGGIPADDFQRVPANFILRDFVPQLAILPKAKAFVTHGGMNSVSESFHFGVPVVVIPYMADQTAVARQAENLGAGLYLRRRNLTGSALRQAVERLLADDQYRRSSIRIGDSLREAGGPRRAVDEIFAFKARHGIG
jgi:MGT family glycosyltransferase